MIKAIKAIERSYVRAPLRQFVLSQKQFAQKPLVSKRSIAMQHDIKKEVK